MKEFVDNQKGIYVISRYAPEYKKDKKIFKIGRTILMNRRLNEYHLCFPNGFYIYCGLTLKNQKLSKKKSIDHLKTIEENIHKKLREQDKHFKSSARRKHEWFYDFEAIKKALQECYEEHSKILNEPIIGFEEPFYNHFVIDGTEEVVAKKLGVMVYDEPNEDILEEEKEGIRRANTPSYMPTANRRGRYKRQIKEPEKLKDSYYIDIKKNVSKKLN